MKYKSCMRYIFMSPMYLSFIHRVSTDVLILRDLLEREATK